MDKALLTLGLFITALMPVKFVTAQPNRITTTPVLLGNGDIVIESAHAYDSLVIYKPTTIGAKILTRSLGAIHNQDLNPTNGYFELSVVDSTIYVSYINFWILYGLGQHGWNRYYKGCIEIKNVLFMLLASSNGSSLRKIFHPTKEYYFFPKPMGISFKSDPIVHLRFTITDQDKVESDSPYDYDPKVEFEL